MTNKKYVYLIEAKNTGLYKIGHARNVNNRLKQLQTGNPMKLVVLHKYESPLANKIETAIHNLLSYSRKEGEWFELDLYDISRFLKLCETFEYNLILVENNEKTKRNFERYQKGNQIYQ